MRRGQSSQGEFGVVHVAVGDGADPGRAVNKGGIGAVARVQGGAVNVARRVEVVAEGEVAAGGFVDLEGWHETVNPVHIERLVGANVEPGEAQAVGVVTVVAAAKFVVFDVEGKEAFVAAQNVVGNGVHNRLAGFFNGYLRRLQDDVGLRRRKKFAPGVRFFGMSSSGNQENQQGKTHDNDSGSGWRHTLTESAATR